MGPTSPGHPFRPCRSPPGTLALTTYIDPYFFICSLDFFCSLDLYKHIEDQIAATLMQYGPLAFDTNALFMQFYFGGIAT